MTNSDVFRRRFFMHPAHKTVGVSAGPAALEVCDLWDFAVGGQRRRPLHVCLVSGCLHYESDRSLAVLEEYLRRRHRLTCSRAFSRRKDDLPGLDHLDESDCLLLFARRMTIPGEQLQRIQSYCRRGGAVVAVRTASHAFGNWPEMDLEVFGSNCQGHYGNRLTEVAVAKAAGQHPVVAGVGRFASPGALYKSRLIDDDATVLLNGTFPGQVHPVAWVRSHRGGRVFCTSLGHPADFRNPGFLRLLANAVVWTSASRAQ